MQIVIDIPKEFEEHFSQDRFEDSLARVSSDIESFGFNLAGRYEQETITMLRKAIKEATVLPEPHGDLIDANKYLKDIQSHYFVNKTVLRCTEIALQNADVVIPAKRGEDR